MKLIDSMIEGAQIADNAGTLEYIIRLSSILVDSVRSCFDNDQAKAVCLVAGALEQTNDQMKEEGF